MASFLSRASLILMMLVAIIFGAYVINGGRVCTTQDCLDAAGQEHDTIVAAWNNLTAAQRERTPEPQETFQNPSAKNPFVAVKEPRAIWHQIDRAYDWLDGFWLLEIVPRGFEKTDTRGISNALSSKAFDLFAIQLIFLLVFVVVLLGSNGGRRYPSWPNEAHYYLGFIFTLLSLGFGLASVEFAAPTSDAAAFKVSDHINSIVKNASAAMLSTIVGVFAYFAFEAWNDAPVPDREPPPSLLEKIGRGFAWLSRGFIAIFRGLFGFISRLYRAMHRTLMHGPPPLDPGQHPDDGPEDDPNDDPTNPAGNGRGPDGPNPPGGDDGGDETSSNGPGPAHATRPAEARRTRNISLRAAPAFKHAMADARMLPVADADQIRRRLFGPYKRKD